MVVQKAIKSYPMVKWFLVVSAILAALGLWQSHIIDDPDNGKPLMLVWFLLPAVLLPFLAMLFPRREVVSLELPTDHLASMSKTELEGFLSQIDAARAKGEMDESKHAKIRERVLAAIKAKGRPGK